MTIAQVLGEGRLIRDKWSDRDAEGRQLLCLYTALAGDPEARPASCPAALAPKWVAYLLPWLDDAPSPGAWREIVERVAAIAERLSLLTPECEWRVRALCVREAMRHTTKAAVLEVCERVAVLCERRGRHEAVPDSDFTAAAAEAAWRAAAAAVAADRLAHSIVSELELDLGVAR